MIHLITVNGKSARQFFLKPEHLADFKSLIRSVTSERVMVISTPFRTDLFYLADKACDEALLTLWAFYANTVRLTPSHKDLKVANGDEQALSTFFEAMNALSINWYYYNVYCKAFDHSFNDDRSNSLALTIAKCDQYLTNLPGIKRTRLVNSEITRPDRMPLDPMSIAMRMINNAHLN